MGKKRRLRIVTEDLARIGDPNAVVVVDPDAADELGACEETALSVEDAWESEPVPDDTEEDVDEEIFVTSLEGLENVPVYPSTDELTGEVISGWGLRARDLRPDGGADLVQAFVDRFFAGLPPPTRAAPSSSGSSELDLATQVLIDPDWAADHGLPRTQKEWERAHEEWLKHAEEYDPED